MRTNSSAETVGLPWSFVEFGTFSHPVCGKCADAGIAPNDSSPIITRMGPSASATPPRFPAENRLTS